MSDPRVPPVWYARTCDGKPNDVRPVRRGDVDDLSVRYVEPDGQPAGVVMWLSQLGGSAEQTHPMLERLRQLLPAE